jgi:glycosyltransferase involved in cell wall biosynthesis
VRESRDARLIVFGRGPCDRARSTSPGASLQDSIDYHGHVPDRVPYMRRADAFVLSSIWEGFGNVFVEGLACGLPGGFDRLLDPAEILSDGAYGRLVPVGNGRALADAMLAPLPEEHDRDGLIARTQDFHVDTGREPLLATLGFSTELPPWPDPLGSTESCPAISSRW